MPLCVMPAHMAGVAIVSGERANLRWRQLGHSGADKVGLADDLAAVAAHAVLGALRAAFAGGLRGAIGGAGRTFDDDGNTLGLGCGLEFVRDRVVDAGGRRGCARRRANGRDEDLRSDQERGDERQDPRGLGHGYSRPIYQDKYRPGVEG